MIHAKHAVCALLIVILTISIFAGALAQDQAQKKMQNQDQGRELSRQESGFSVRAVLPENQISDNVSYFYLHIQPGETQTLEIIINNGLLEDAVVALTANTASTSRLGFIDYNGSQEKDPSIAVDFSSLVTIQEPEVTIPAQEEATVKFHLQMPDEPFEGELLGGFVITKLPGEKEMAQEVASGAGIVNLYAYAIAVRIRQQDTEIEPELEIAGANIETLGGHMALEILVKNKKPVIIKGATLEAAVYPEGSDTAIFAVEEIKFDMAPNTWMPYSVIFHRGMPFSPGAYQVKVTIKHNDLTLEATLPMRLSNDL